MVKWKAYYFDGDNGENIREEEIPEAMLEECKEKKLELIGQLAEFDESMEEYYMDENCEVPVEDLKRIIRE